MAWNQRDKEPNERLRALADMASDLNIDPHIPIRRYFRSGSEMLKMGEIYYKEDSLESAYILFFKYVTLHIEKIKQHPDYKDVLPTEKKSYFSTVKKILSQSEKVKAELRKIYEAEFEEWLKEAAELAAREEERRKREEKALQEKFHNEREKMMAIERDREVALWHQAQIDKEMGSSRGAGGQNHQDNPPGYDQVVSGSSSGAEYSKPPVYNPADYQDTPPAPYQDTPSAPSFFPETPTKVSNIPAFDRSTKPSAPPSISPPPPFPSSSNPSFPPSSSNPSIPDRGSKPSISSQSSLTSSGLRHITVPNAFMAEFLTIAASNTARNVETCGILGGKLAQNKFVVSHLVIPKQSGTSDSCSMEGEEELWEYQDGEGLMTLGWIHTHPTQTAFLSSVDMHCQYGYQIMLPEALAIVCSPKYDETGFFSLTRDHGLKEIGRCTQVGFHPHPKEPPLFEEGSHVTLDQSAKVIVKDLRF